MRTGNCKKLKATFRKCKYNYYIMNKYDEYRTCVKILHDRLSGKFNYQNLYFPLIGLFVNGQWVINIREELLCKIPFSKQFVVLTPNNAIQRLGQFISADQLVGQEDIIIRLVELIRDIRLAEKADGDEGIFKQYKQRVNWVELVIEKYNDFLFFDDNFFHKDGVLIHGKNYKKALKWLAQTEPTFREFQAYIRLAKEKKLVGFNTRTPTWPVRRMNAAIHYLDNKNYVPVQRYSDEVPNEKRDRDKHTPAAKYTTAEKTYYGYGTFGFEDFIKDSGEWLLSVPPVVQEQVAEIVDGDIAAVDQLAELVACCCLEIPVKPRLWAIMTNRITTICNFLNVVFSEEQQNASIRMEVNPKNTFGVAGITALIENTYRGLPFVQLQASVPALVLNDVYFRLLKKAITMKPIVLSQQGVGKLTYINRSQWVIFIKQEKELRTYKEYLGELVETVALPKVNISDDTREADVASGIWLTTIFAIYGLTKMLENRKVVEPYDPYALIESFLKETCVLGDHEICYKDELYEAYSLYLQNRYSMKPIPKGRFHNLISSKPNILETRPRTSRADNKRGYRGISVDMKKAEVDSPERRKEKIASYLDAINKKVLTLLELNGDGGIEKQPNSEGDKNDENSGSW